jgi:hypothetical protein
MTSIFDDRESLIKIWIDERRSRDFQASLMWENVKYFTTLLSALITADVFILRMLLDLKINSTIFANTNYPVIILFSSLILPSFIIVASILGERELKRRWRRILEAIANCAKIEYLLGLNENISHILKVFPNDSYLFQRWTESRKKYSSSSSFVEGELKGYNMYTHMRKIYFITIFVGVFLIVIHTLLFILV